MPRSYKIAIAIGFILCFIALWASARVPVGPEWELPSLEYQSLPHTSRWLELYDLGLLLRGADNFLKNGFWYLVLTIGPMCMLANLYERTKADRYVAAYTRSFFITLSFALVVIVSFSWAAVQGDGNAPRFLAEKISDAFLCAFFLTVFSTASLVLPIFWLLVHCLVVLFDFYTQPHSAPAESAEVVSSRSAGVDLSENLTVGM